MPARSSALRRTGLLVVPVVLAASLPLAPASAGGMRTDEGGGTDRGVAPAAIAPHTLTKAGYVLSNGNTGTIDLATANPAEDSPAVVPGGRMPIVVSLGDSYISGEAGRWAGNADRPSWSSYADAGKAKAYWDIPGAEAIPYCHRSTSAEINIPGNGVASVNLACSGATTSTAADAPLYKPGVDFSDTTLTGGAKALGQAKLLENLATSNPGRVQMVVLSIGGNDFNFEPIVEACLEAYMYWDAPCSTNPTVLANFSEQNIADQQAAILGAINNVLTAMSRSGYSSSQWSLLVQTYPSPVAGSETIRYPQNYDRQFVGGCGMYDVDLDWANGYALRTINDSVTNAVVQARTDTGPRIQIMNLSDAMLGHRLCEQNTNLVGPLDWYPIIGYIWSVVRSWDQKDPVPVNLSEWVAQIRIGTKKDPDGYLPFQLQESLHPNWWGQKAIGSCVIQAWNKGDGVLGGKCVYAAPGLAGDRPRMLLQQVPSAGQQVAIPAKVRDLHASPRPDGVAKVAWRPPSTGKVAGYEYRVRRGDQAWGAWSSVGVSTETFLSVLRRGPRYTVQVRATNAGGDGPTDSVSFTIPR